MTNSARPVAASPDDVEIARGITIKQYRAWESEKNVEAIASFAVTRLRERYISPWKHIPREHKSGFAMMASSCLLIEGFQAHKEGWPDTNGKSRLAFCSFFDTENEFSAFRGFAGDFYKHVRCGILHRGETTGGWKVRRDRESIFDPPSLTIDANHFIAALDRTLGAYQNQLSEGAWDSPEWAKLRRKLKATIADSTATGDSP